MKKIALLVIAGLVLVGSYYWFNRSGSLGSQTTPASEFTGNLMEAMHRNLPLHCTWTSGDNSGEAYVSGDNLYAESMMNGHKAYTIRQGNCSYVWGDQVNQAMKICTEAMASGQDNQAMPEATPGSGGQAESQGPDLNMSYHCVPTVISQGRFTPPSDINFTDLGEMMDQMMQKMPAMPSAPAVNY